MPEISDDVYVVFGATGKQGGAVARELLRRGHRVRTVVRNPQAAPAEELAVAGAKLAIGDMEDPSSPDAALKGTYGAYSVQTFTGLSGSAGEIRQGARPWLRPRPARAWSISSTVGGWREACERGPALREQAPHRGAHRRIRRSRDSTASRHAHRELCRYGLGLEQRRTDADPRSGPRRACG